MKYYTGVGSRTTPDNVLALMRSIAIVLRNQGYILRSGGAKGADTAFESGAGEQKEIYYASDATKDAMDIASIYHPAWNKCSSFAKKLHGRNAFQVLGRSLGYPSEFLICWTLDGCMSHPERSWGTGGTGTAISIAWANGIPVENLGRQDIYDKWVYWVNNY
jgi:hypothetical protein